MGTSTDAKLLYGIPLEEGAFDDFDEDEDDGTTEHSGPSWMAFSGRAEDGCTLESHQSKEVPRYFVCPDGARTYAKASSDDIAKTGRLVAWRGHPICVTAKRLDPHPEWDALLRAFVAKHGLKVVGEPGWYLASDWC